MLLYAINPRKNLKVKNITAFVDKESKTGKSRKLVHHPNTDWHLNLPKLTTHHPSLDTWSAQISSASPTHKVGYFPSYLYMNLSLPLLLSFPLLSPKTTQKTPSKIISPNPNFNSNCRTGASISPLYTLFISVFFLLNSVVFCPLVCGLEDWILKCSSYIHGVGVPESTAESGFLAFLRVLHVRRSDENAAGE